MGIRIDCVECKQQMVDGILRHTDSCSANNFVPKVGHGMRPPATSIHFDTPEEREKFMKGLNGSSGAVIPSPSPSTQQQINEAVAAAERQTILVTADLAWCLGKLRGLGYPAEQIEKRWQLTANQGENHEQTLTGKD